MAIGRQKFLAWAMISPCLLVSGCGPHSDLRGVEGRVTLDGQPVTAGTIEFTPTSGTKGGLAGASIEAGSYSVPQERGVRAGGTYRVSIVAMKKTGKHVEGFRGPDGKPLDEFANYIPVEYNSASKVTVRITSNYVNHIDFPLMRDGSWRGKSEMEAKP
jgi:hypothetical protein